MSDRLRSWVGNCVTNTIVVLLVTYIYNTTKIRTTQMIQAGIVTKPSMSMLSAAVTRAGD